MRRKELFVKRSSGILMHITSLPSPHGIGTMGQAARDFIDFLSAAGQRYWQMLPLGPVAFGQSPYQSPSSCGGNPLLIDLDELAADGLLSPVQAGSAIGGDDDEFVDFDRVKAERDVLFPLAYLNWKKAGDGSDLAAFRAANADWLEDHALFLAIKKEQNGAQWTQWPAGLRDREEQAMAAAKERLENKIEYHCFVQMIFYKQWDALKAYAKEKGIGIIGDVPIYAAMDSADVWASPNLFLLEEDTLLPSAIAGVPPDYFSAKGQLWGNPLYDWAAMAEDDYRWWIRRLSCAHRLFDVVRIDHFRALSTYWSVPADAEDATTGHWEEGPGLPFLQKIAEELPGLELIAEDLGYLTEDVVQLLKDSGLPGMKVLQFGFDNRDFTDYQPHTFTRNCVVYTGTHDNDTLAGWLRSAGENTLGYLREYLGLGAYEDLAWPIIRMAQSSVADLAIAQMQDVLMLPSSHRMNVPSTIGTNWRWRMKKGAADEALAERLAAMAKLYSRI
ncbi:MAG: 4-alpha-glucanotransferase [Christensenellaceae bacterium]|nr:4-alpha-glucanotransferase [Christensenellaceae bacterium]